MPTPAITLGPRRSPDTTRWNSSPNPSDTIRSTIPNAARSPSNRPNEMLPRESLRRVSLNPGYDTRQELSPTLRARASRPPRSAFLLGRQPVLEFRVPKLPRDSVDTQ